MFVINILYLDFFFKVFQIKHFNILSLIFIFLTIIYTVSDLFLQYFEFESYLEIIILVILIIILLVFLKVTLDINL